MDLQQAQVLIRKVNSLFKSMEMDGSPQPTPIERDLMLSYLRQLYQTFLAEGTETNKVTAIPPVVEVHISPPPITPVKPEEPAAPVYEAPKAYIPPVATIVEAPKAETPPPIEIREEPKVYIPPVEVPKVVPVPEPLQPIIQPAQSTNSRLESLFSFKKATELSEKLSEMPIADLTKGMSINDRLLYMNELFGRDMTKLDEVLRALNNFPSIESAKSYLLGIAAQYDWGEEERSEIAQSFIKLVRRRYV